MGRPGTLFPKSSSCWSVCDLGLAGPPRTREGAVERFLRIILLPLNLGLLSSQKASAGPAGWVATLLGPLVLSTPSSHAAPASCPSPGLLRSQMPTLGCHLYSDRLAVHWRSTPSGSVMYSNGSQSWGKCSPLVHCEGHSAGPARWQLSGRGRGSQAPLFPKPLLLPSRLSGQVLCSEGLYGGLSTQA